MLSNIIMHNRSTHEYVHDGSVPYNRNERGN